MTVFTVFDILLIMKNMFSFLIPDKYISFDPNQPPSETNPSGGIATKYSRVREAAEQFWNIELISDVDKLNTDILFIEPLWFALDNKDESEFIKKIDSVLKLDCKQVILYCSEMCIVKWPNQIRQKLLDRMDAVTTCGQYHRRIFRYANIPVTHTLCDPVPADQFKPDFVKKRTVIAMGQISWHKNSRNIANIFKAIQEYSDIKTIYMGSTSLWGGNTQRNTALQEAIQTYSDEFISHASVPKTAEKLNSSMFFLHGAIHDTYSESQAEAGSAGCITFGIGHPFLEERPTLWGFDTPEHLATQMQKLDDNDQQAYAQKARQFALEHYAYPVFQKQLANIILEK